VPHHVDQMDQHGDKGEQEAPRQRLVNELHGVSRPAAAAGSPRPVSRVVC
jgi:hypothetical protein